MEEKFIYSILISLIGVLFGIVIKLITEINKEQKTSIEKLNKELTIGLNSLKSDFVEARIKTEKLLTNLDNASTNITETKSSLDSFRNDLTTLQADVRNLNEFKKSIEDRVLKLENLNK